MAACEEQVFSGVASEHVAMFLAKGKQFGLAGVTEQGHSGQTSYSGFSLRWEYSQDERMLTVQCTESPMLVPCALINSKIRDAVASALRQTTVPVASTEQV
jgi:hypothetical protein